MWPAAIRIGRESCTALDRDTSGLLVVARSEEAHRLLQEALRKRLIEREYLALVEGLPPARTGTIEAPIGRHPRIRTRMAVGGTASREARTHFTLERSLPGVSLLRLRLDTGRTHQIRVHLQAIGHPVCGDPEYGTAGMLGLTRQFLHATRLAFPTRSRESRSRSTRHCLRICAKRSSGPRPVPAVSDSIKLTPDLADLDIKLHVALKRSRAVD